MRSESASAAREWSLYLLRSAASPPLPVSVVVVCKSAEEVVARLSRDPARSEQGGPPPIVCIGPPSINDDRDRGRTMLSALCYDLALIAGIRPTPRIAVETVPSAILSLPSIQRWYTPQSATLERYANAEAYNMEVRDIAAAHDAWLLDVDRSIARRGTSLEDSGLNDPAALQRELEGLLAEIAASL